MKALIWNGPKDVVLTSVPEPDTVEQDDAIIEVSHSAICGSDIHAYTGRIQGMVPGTIMGHEYVGRVIKAGPELKRIRPGDAVFGSFFTACGSCPACRQHYYSQCATAQLFGFGPKFGGLPGTQSEYARIPHADTTLHRRPL